MLRRVRVGSDLAVSIWRWGRTFPSVIRRRDAKRRWMTMKFSVFIASEKVRIMMG